MQLVGQVLDIAGDVLVVEAALLQNRQLLQHLALDHGDAVLFGHIWVGWLFDQVTVDGQNDARHLFLGRIVQDAGHYRDGIEFVHLFGQQRVECQDPDAENQLILHLTRELRGNDTSFGGLVKVRAGIDGSVNGRNYLEVDTGRQDAQ